MSIYPIIGDANMGHLVISMPFATFSHCKVILFLSVIEMLPSFPLCCSVEAVYT